MKILIVNFDLICFQFLLLQFIGIKKMKLMFFVVMQVEVENVHRVMFVGKIEAKSKFSFLFF